MPSSSPKSGRGEREAVLDVDRAGAVLGVVRELVLLVVAQAQVRRWRGRRSATSFARGSRQNSYHFVRLVGWQNNSISICSNSRERKMKLRGVTSLRKLLPICAMPNGTFTRVVSTTFLKLRKMPCAVSGRR